MRCISYVSLLAFSVLLLILFVIPGPVLIMSETGNSVNTTSQTNNYIFQRNESDLDFSYIGSRKLGGQRLAISIAGSGPVLIRKVSENVFDTANRSYSAGRFAIMIDGSNTGYLNPSINAFLSGNQKPVAGKIYLLGRDNKARQQSEFFNAVITGIKSPVFDANTDSTKRRYFELVLSATALKRSEPADFKINIQKSAKKWLPSYFRIELGDLPSNRVAKIDSFTIKQVVIKDQVSKAKQSAVVPSSVEVPNLKITFSASDSHYRAWNAMSKKPVSEQKRLLSGKLILSSSGGTSEFTHMKLYEARIASIQKGENSFTVTVALSGMRFSNP